MTQAGELPIGPTPMVGTEHGLAFLSLMSRRAAITAGIRRVFDDQGFVEVDTPVALSAPAPEPEIETFPVPMGEGAEREVRYLQPSPELPMKRLLAQGMERIYQIAPVFRSEAIGPQHRPEFRMLEWYRAPGTWDQLITDCEVLLARCAEVAGVGPTVTFGDRRVDLSQPLARVTVEEAFVRWAGFSILDALEEETLRARLAELRLPTAPDDTWNDLYHRVFLSLVEPGLCATFGSFVLTHYPATLASLAQLDPEDPRVAQRCEVYLGGVELANSFGELIDAGEQRQRFLRDRKLRLDRQMHDYPLDERFLAGLSQTPPCAGMALGVDRLIMILLDAPDLDAVSSIPWGQS